MPGFKIVSDSSCEYTKEQAIANDVTIVPFYITFNGIDYRREFVDLQLDEFYRILRNEKVFPKTSQPTVNDYYSVFKNIIDNEDKDILCINLTSKFSGSHQSALLARDTIHEEYPDRKILVINSQHCTAAQGIIVSECCAMRDKGIDIEKVAEHAATRHNDFEFYVTVDSLVYLQRGGRIGRTASLAGGVFHIKPIIYYKEGELLPYTKLIGRKNALNEIIKTIKKLITLDESKYGFLIVHSDCYDEALAFRESVKTALSLSSEPIISSLGVTIGSHIGPTVLALGMYKKMEF